MSQFFSIAHRNCIFFCTVTDDILHNVALNKPPYQVSTYTEQFGAHDASLANDGITNTCARSQRETNPWWAVDLGVDTLVAQVNLTNTDDAGSDLHLMFFSIFSVLHELTTTLHCIVFPLTIRAHSASLSRCCIRRIRRLKFLLVYWSVFIVFNILVSYHYSAVDKHKLAKYSLMWLFQ